MSHDMSNTLRQPFLPPPAPVFVVILMRAECPGFEDVSLYLYDRLTSSNSGLAALKYVTLFEPYIDPLGQGGPMPKDP